MVIAFANLYFTPSTSPTSEIEMPNHCKWKQDKWMYGDLVFNALSFYYYFQTRRGVLRAQGLGPFSRITVVQATFWVQNQTFKS